MSASVHLLLPSGSDQASSNSIERMRIEPKTLPQGMPSKYRVLKRPRDPDFSLEIIQQPAHAKVAPCPPSHVFPPFAEHRPIHPPPVLQLKLNGYKPSQDAPLSDEFLASCFDPQNPKAAERAEELGIIRSLRRNKVPVWTHYSTFFVTARLRVAEGQSEQALFNNSNETSTNDLLLGSRVSSGMIVPLRTTTPSNSSLRIPVPADSPRSDAYAVTFVFPDLSVRKIGRFVLDFDLFEIHRGRFHWRAAARSTDFTVYTPKKFPGSLRSTALTSFLYKYGARIRQRKRVPARAPQQSLPPTLHTAATAGHSAAGHSAVGHSAVPGHSVASGRSVVAGHSAAAMHSSHSHPHSHSHSHRRQLSQQVDYQPTKFTKVYGSASAPGSFSAPAASSQSPSPVIIYGPYQQTPPPQRFYAPPPPLPSFGIPAQMPPHQPTIPLSNTQSSMQKLPPVRFFNDHQHHLQFAPQPQPQPQHQSIPVVLQPAMTPQVIYSRPTPPSFHNYQQPPAGPSYYQQQRQADSQSASPDLYAQHAQHFPPLPQIISQPPQRDPRHREERPHPSSNPYDRMDR